MGNSNSDQDFSEKAKSILDTAITVAIVTFPAVPHIPQIIYMINMRTSVGFSHKVAFFAICGHVLRISYWTGRPYDLAILGQSFVVILTMITMLTLYVKYNRPTDAAAYQDPNRYFLAMDFRWFWNWIDMASYLQCILFMIVLITFPVIYLSWVPGVLDIVGAAAVCCDMLLYMPILTGLFVHNDTTVINKTTVTIWGLGDIFQLSYIITSSKPQPMPYVASTTLCASLDFIVLSYLTLHGGDSSID